MAKFALLRDRLREADYIVLSTNRLHRTIPRLPARYPVSTEFYRRLFAEELGFVREAEFTAYPGLLAACRSSTMTRTRALRCTIIPSRSSFAKCAILKRTSGTRFLTESLAQTPVQEAPPRSAWALVLAWPGEQSRALALAL